MQPGGRIATEGNEDNEDPEAASLDVWCVIQGELTAVAISIMFFA
jgi:hypothetical protein